MIAHASPWVCETCGETIEVRRQQLTGIGHDDVDVRMCARCRYLGRSKYEPGERVWIMCGDCGQMFTRFDVYTDGWGARVCRPCGIKRAQEPAAVVRYVLLRRRDDDTAEAASRCGEQPRVSWVLIAPPSTIPLAVYTVGVGPEGMAEALLRAAVDRWRVLSQVSAGVWLLWRDE